MNMTMDPIVELYCNFVVHYRHKNKCYDPNIGYFGIVGYWDKYMNMKKDPIVEENCKNHLKHKHKNKYYYPIFCLMGM